MHDCKDHNWEILDLDQMVCSKCDLSSDMADDSNTTALERSHILERLIEYNIQKLDEMYGYNFSYALSNMMEKMTVIALQKMRANKNLEDFDGDDVDRICNLLKLKLNLELGNW